MYQTLKSSRLISGWLLVYYREQCKQPDPHRQVMSLWHQATSGTKGHGSSTHTNTLHMASVWTQASLSTRPLANHKYTFKRNMCWLWLTTNHPKEWSSAWTVQTRVWRSISMWWTIQKDWELERLTTCSARRRAWRLDACHQCVHWTLCIRKERKENFQNSSTAHTPASVMH